MPAERIRRLAGSQRLARHAGFWWGFAEGLFFFIVPDVYITFATLFAPRAGAVAWLASIGGSAVAVVCIHALSAAHGADYLSFLATLPGISVRMLEHVEGRVASDGLPWTPLLALGGVPLKVYAALAFVHGRSLAAVLGWTVFARLVRIAPAWAFVAALRRLFARRIDAHGEAWCALHVLVWVAFYTFYFVRMSRP